MLRWLWLSLAVIGLDQFTKQLIETRFAFRESLEVLPFFNLTLVYNEGAAFSFLSDQGGWQRWFSPGDPRGRAAHRGVTGVHPP